jgi:hypothetical protein
MTLASVGAAAGVSDGIVQRLSAIDELDLRPARDRMEVDFPGTNQDFPAVSSEVKRFLALALLEPDPGHRLVIGEKIDGLWHYFILHTIQYRKFCDSVFGSYLHHVPILPHQKNQLAEDYDKTRALYRRYFGEPPSRLWGDGDMICWGGCDEITESRLERMQ